MEKSLKEIFDEYKIPNNESKLNKFDKYYEDMIKYNEIHNLTAITDRIDVNYKHFLDSILPYKIFATGSKIIDIGCGAGFPSIPLCIMRDDIHILAIDSVNKKVEFIKNEINNLNLNNLDTMHTRIEDLAHNENYREKFDYVVSRAVAPLNIILEYSAPFLKNNGYIVAYKGSNYEEEIKLSDNAINKLNCVIEKVIEFEIKEIEAKRYIILIKKLNNISKTYPRAKNKPRTNPL